MQNYNKNNTVMSYKLDEMFPFWQLLFGLEAGIAEYEQAAGLPQSAEPGKTQATFSGYTSALVDAITRLTMYLKQVTV